MLPDIKILNSFFDYDGADGKKKLHSIYRVISPDQRKFARKFINKHHSYIKWAERPSRKLYWLLYENDEPVGVFGLGSAFDRPKAIQDFMKTHEISFNELGNNIVYCMAGHTDRNSGTKFLSLIRKDAVMWWKEKYGDDLKALQTFILPPRNGAVYRADNWMMIGETTGNSMVTKPLKKSEWKKYEFHPDLSIRKFKDGSIVYRLKSYVETNPKLIFVKLLERKK